MELGWGPSITLKMVRSIIFPSSSSSPHHHRPPALAPEPPGSQEQGHPCGYHQHHTGGLKRTPPCRSAATTLASSDACYPPLAHCPIVTLSHSGAPSCRSTSLAHGRARGRQSPHPIPAMATRELRLGGPSRCWQHGRRPSPPLPVVNIVTLRVRPRPRSRLPLRKG